MIANHHKTFQCQLSYFNCQLPVLAVVYLMQDLHFQIMLLDGSFIHVDRYLLTLRMYTAIMPKLWYSWPIDSSLNILLSVRLHVIDIS